MEAVVMTPTRIHHLHRENDSFIYTGEQPTAIYIARTSGTLTCHKVDKDFDQLEIPLREKFTVGIKVHNATELPREVIEKKFYTEYAIAVELLKKNGIELTARDNRVTFIHYEETRLKRRIQHFLCGQSKKRIETITNEDKNNIHIFYVRSVSGNPRNGVVCNAPSPHVILGQKCSETLLAHEIGHTLGLTDLEASELSPCVRSLLEDKKNIMQPSLKSREHLRLGQIIHAHVNRYSALNDKGRCNPTLDWAWKIQQCGDTYAPPLDYPNTHGHLGTSNRHSTPSPHPPTDIDITNTVTGINEEVTERTDPPSTNDTDLSDVIIQDLLCECACNLTQSEKRLNQYASENEQAYSIIRTITEQGDYDNKIETIIRESLKSAQNILAEAEINLDLIPESYIGEIKTLYKDEELDAIIEERKRDIQQRAKAISEAIRSETTSKTLVSTSHREEEPKELIEITAQKTQKEKQPRRGSTFD